MTSYTKAAHCTSCRKAFAARVILPPELPQLPDAAKVVITVKCPRCGTRQRQTSTARHLRAVGEPWTMAGLEHKLRGRRTK